MTAPLPTSAGGPTSAVDVAGWLQRDAGDTAAVERLEPLALAVNSLVRRWLSPLPSGEWRPEHKLGATMLGARLWRRRNSVDGVATFTAEGAAYVQRNDPDVALLLQLGAYAPPVVG